MNRDHIQKLNEEKVCIPVLGLGLHAQTRIFV